MIAALVNWKPETFSANMVAQTNSFDHPTDEMFERLVLHRSEQTELEILESHLLACDSCLSRVKDLRNQIIATKLALQTIKRKQAARAAAKIRLARLNQLTPTVLSLPVIAGVLIGVLFLIPPGIRKNASIAKVSLSVYRESEQAVLPQGRPVHVTLDAAGLPNAPVVVEIVDPLGSKLWRGDAAVFREKAEILVPQITQSGVYLLRLYSAPVRDKKSEILMEFVFHVK